MPENKSILVTGANGQLGQSIRKMATRFKEFTFDYIDLKQLDLSRPDLIAAFFQQRNFDIIINCAAYTAVDKAEDDIELANKINHEAVRELAQVCKNQNKTLIHISTDYVFDGQHHLPYTESDPTNPQSVYGASKLRGEQAVQSINPHGAIIRTSWLYSEFGHNFVKTMLKLGQEREQLSVVCDQIGTPTYAGDLAASILTMIRKGLPQLTDIAIYHFSNEGVCSWYDFAQAIFAMTDCNCRLQPIESSQYPTPAKRPHYSVLNKTRIKRQFDLEIPHWRVSLSDCLLALKESTH